MNYNSIPPSASILVVGLPGSLRSTSLTRQAVARALEGAAQGGARTRLIDLRDYDIPLDIDYSSEPPEGVRRLRQDIDAAQGIILGTPEYHGSFSGVLKHALDQMGFDEFEGKLIGLVGVSGGRLGAVNALNGLRTVGRALHAWVVPKQVSIPEAWKQFNRDGGLKNTELDEALLSMGRQVAEFASLHVAQRSGEFLDRWESAPTNPGGKHPPETGE